MKRKFPKSELLDKIQKTLHGRKKTWRDNIKAKFVFLGVWKKAVGARLTSFGRTIERVSPPWLKKIARFVARPFRFVAGKIRKFMKRRPHRSFRLTERRDYKRSLKLPGYWSFTNSVRAMLWRHKKLFGGLVVVYFLVAVAIGGFGQQEAYRNLSDTLTETGSEVFTGNFAKVGEAGLLLTTSVATGLTPNATEAQGVLAGLAAFFAWLATVWALRATMADRTVRIRDAIYSSGAPVLSTVLVGFALVVQLLPVSIATLVYNAAIQSGLIAGGVEQMLAWVVIGLLVVLSLYWLTATLIALVVVTLPGMYPFQAIKTAGDLVVGRRIRILLRLIWMALVVLVLWLLILIPIILADGWIKDVWAANEWVDALPIVPLSILFMSSLTVIFVATYIYMLYRKVVDDDAKPA